MTKEYNKNSGKGNTSTPKFDIRDYVEFDHNGRAVCPNCGTEGGKKNLSVLDSGAYKCFKCDDIEAIRDTLGVPKPKIIPTALAKPPQKKPKYLVPEATILENATQLFSGQGKYSFLALNWLKERGIIPEIAKEFKLGLARSRVEGKDYWSISIPIPSEGKYYQKKRLVPWDKDNPVQDIRPWSQASIPKMVYFTHLPEQAKETWLCEGEWDAILLGWLVKHFQPEGIAVGCFTCGCKTIPGKAELDRLPGQVKIFYDRNDKLIKGKRAGEEGAKKLAQALGDRGEIALVPMPDHCTTQGWDVSDALNYGYRFEEFELAASQAQAYQATKPPTVTQSENSLLKNMVSYWDIMQTAPDFIDWLIYEILSPNELFLLAAPPRAGKSLLALSLAKAIAGGGEFLGRPCRQGKVIYVNIEDSRTKVKRRLMAQDWSEAEAKNVFEINKFSLDQLPELEEIIKIEQPRLVVLDTLSRIRKDGYCESSAEMANAISPLQEVASANNCCILLVHHTRKKGLEEKETSDVFDSVRGSGAIRATCRGMLVLVESKGKYRLVIENGDAEVQDLQVYLNPSNLNWKLLGKWNLNVNLTQKEQVLAYLESVKSASVAQIAENTGIPQSSIYKVLIRLVKDNAIKSSTKTDNTVLYYSTKLVLTSQKLSDGSKDYPDSDTANLTNFAFFSESSTQSTQKCNEMLQPLRTLRTDSQKSNFVRLVRNGDKNVDIDNSCRSDKDLTSQTISGEKNTSVRNDHCVLSSETAYLGHITKNFNEKVRSESESTDIKAGDKVSGNCTNTKIDEWTGTVESINGGMASVTWSDGSSNLVGLDLLKKIE